MLWDFLRFLNSLYSSKESVSDPKEDVEGLCDIDDSIFLCFGRSIDPFRGSLSRIWAFDEDFSPTTVLLALGRVSYSLGGGGDGDYARIIGLPELTLKVA